MLVLEYAKNPIWGNENNTAILLTVKWEEFSDEMPFSATPNDVEPWGVMLFNRALNEEFGVVAEYVKPIQSAEYNKQKAMKLLSESDWSALESISNPLMSDPYLMNQPEFLDYRNALRRIAINPVAGDLDWPNKPQESWSV